MHYADQHIHSNFSTDGRDTLNNMAASAMDKGLPLICFTEHMDYDSHYPDGIFEVDTDVYLNDFTELKNNIKAPLELCFGVELGLQPHLVDHFNEYVNNYPFDLVLGSSHIVDGMDAAFPKYYNSFTTEKAANMRYFEAELHCAELFSCFDIYAHLDYALRYAPSGTSDFDYSEYGDVLDSLLKTLIDKGKGIEVNTGGLRKSFKRLNPHPSILKRYRELGGEIVTIGSDAHNTSDIASVFDIALSALSDSGFRYYCVFRERKAEYLRI